MSQKPMLYTHNGHTGEVRFPQWGHAEMAGQVRMLSRNDIMHEPIVTAARDRILHLAQRNAELEQALTGAVEMLTHIQNGGDYRFGDYTDRLTAFEKLVAK